MPLSTKAILTQNDIHSIRRILAQRGEWRNLLLFEICLYTAWKVTDILEMKVNHVIDSDGNIKQYIELLGNKYTRQREYNLPMTNTIKEVLWKYLKQYKFLMVSPNAYLFFQLKTYPLGQYPISRQMFWVYMKQWCHMTGISDEFSADSLRRTWAYYAYQQGFSLEQIQYRLGFASLDMTKAFLGLQSQDHMTNKHFEL